jgi:hypothetical protein
MNLGNFRRRVWQPALESGGFVQCPLSGEHLAKHIGREYRCQEARLRGAGERPSDLRPPAHVRVVGARRQHLDVRTARYMGTSVKIIDRHYGHLVHDSEETVRAKLDAYASGPQPPR